MSTSRRPAAASCSWRYSSRVRRSRASSSSMRRAAAASSQPWSSISAWTVPPVHPAERPANAAWRSCSLSKPSSPRSGGTNRPGWEASRARSAEAPEQGGASRNTARGFFARRANGWAERRRRSIVLASVRTVFSSGLVSGAAARTSRATAAGAWVSRSAASRSSTGASNTAATRTGSPSRSCRRLVRIATWMELPPSSKKLSRAPTRSTPRTCFHSSARKVSSGVRGATQGRSGARSSRAPAAARARTSTLPWAVNGSSGRTTQAVGIM